jgi:adenylate cyclase
MEPGETEPTAGLDGAEQKPDDESPQPTEVDPDSAETRARRFRRFAAGLDSQPTLLTATRRLRRRLPGDERFGDSLSTDGSRAVHLIGRGVSALGQPGRESVLQELGLAGLQVWQSLSEATGRGHGDQEMAIMFTDLVSFSSWALKAGDTAVIDLLREVGEVLEEAVTDGGGRIVKRLGDGIMATFLDPRAAVDAALTAQDGISEIDADGHCPRMRAGIHWGSPRKLGGDYLGVDVNVAARVGAAAKAEQVLVSDALLGQIDTGDLKIGRAKRLKAEGAPRNLEVASVSRA